MELIFNYIAYIEFNIFCGVIIATILFFVVFYKNNYNKRISPLIVIVGLMYISYLINDAVFLAKNEDGSHSHFSAYLSGAGCMISLLLMSAFWLLYVARELDVRPLRHNPWRLLSICPAILMSAYIASLYSIDWVQAVNHDFNFGKSYIYTFYILMTFGYIIISSIMAACKYAVSSGFKKKQAASMGTFAIPIVVCGIIQYHTDFGAIHLGYIIALVLYFLQRFRDLQAEYLQGQLEAQAEEQKKDILVASMSPELELVFEMNMDTGENNVLVCSDPYYLSFFAKNCSYDEFILQVAQRIVSTDDIRDFCQTLDSDNLREFFKTETTCQVKYRTNQVRTMYFNTIVKKKFPANLSDPWLVIGVRNITQIAQQKSASEKIKDVFGALAKDYDYIAYTTNHLNKFNDRAEIYKMSDDFAYFTQGMFKDDNFHNQLEIFEREAVHPDDREEFRAATRRETVQQHLKDNDSYIVSFRLVLEGRTIPYQLKYVPFINESGDGGYIVGGYSMDEVYSRELELRKELEIATEEAQKANKAKTDFLYSMSHDIRTPLNSILGYNDLSLLNLDDKEKVESYLLRSKKSGQHLVGLVNEILDIAKIESGNLELDRKVCSVVSVVREAVDMVSELAKSKNVKLTLKYDKQDHSLCYADELRLKQVIVNIVNNAVKYTNPGGHVKCQIVMHGEVKDGFQTYQFVCDDDGIGMSQDMLDKIFDNFTRANRFGEEHIEGSGLGMPIVKQILDATNGKIKIESEEDIGTTITINQHFKTAEEDESIIRKKTSSRKKVSGMNILLVDDNELNREICREILSQLDVNITEANDGRQAFELIDSSPAKTFDIVLMDIEMPVMDGYESTRNIRTLSDETKSNIPIIALTANAFLEDRRKAIDAGMNSFLTKPIDIVKLKSRLAEYK